MDRKTKLIVLGLIQNEKKEFLTSVRFDPKVPEAHLKFDFVGGTNEFGESLEATLVREIREETGLEVIVLKMFPWSISKVWKHEDFEMHAVVFCFWCRKVGGIIHLNDPKIESLHWNKFSELLKNEFLQTTRFFLDKIKDYGIERLEELPEL